MCFQICQLLFICVLYRGTLKAINCSFRSTRHWISAVTGKHGRKLKWHWIKRKVSEVASEVAQSCPTLSDPMDCSLPGSPSMGFSRQEYWSGLPLPSPRPGLKNFLIDDGHEGESSPHLLRTCYLLVILCQVHHMYKSCGSQRNPSRFRVTVSLSSGWQSLDSERLSYSRSSSLCQANPDFWLQSPLP